MALVAGSGRGGAAARRRRSSLWPVSLMWPLKAISPPGARPR